MKLDLEKCLHCISTQLVVADIERSIQFYTESLGSDLNFSQDFYAGLGAGPFPIHLKHGDHLHGDHLHDDHLQTLPEETDHVDIVIGVTDLDSCYESVLAKSIKVIQPLRKTPYGREFYIEDPDGHRLAFFDVTS